MFTLVLNNYEEFKLTLWDGQSFDLTADNLITGIHLEPLPCTLEFSTGTATGLLYAFGESEATIWELASNTLSGHMVKWGSSTTVVELQTAQGPLYGRLYGAGAAQMELGSVLNGSGGAVIADPSQWNYVYELDTASPQGNIDRWGKAGAEMELATETGILYGAVNEYGAAALELMTPDGVAGGAQISDPSQGSYIYELRSETAASTVVAPLYVGDEIDETISALGDITMAEYCWKEIIA